MNVLHVLIRDLHNRNIININFILFDQMKKKIQRFLQTTFIFMGMAISAVPSCFLRSISAWPAFVRNKLCKDQFSGIMNTHRNGMLSQTGADDHMLLLSVKIPAAI